MPQPQYSPGLLPITFFYYGCRNPKNMCISIIEDVKTTTRDYLKAIPKRAFRTYVVIFIIAVRF